MPPRVWFFGVMGPWGYTICFFVSYRLIPPVDATLLLMSWPIIVLVGNAALVGRRMRWWHLAGALAGFAGAAILVISRGEGQLTGGGPLYGYLIAFGGALAFAAYNLGRNAWQDVPTDSNALFCLGGAVLSAVLHPIFETTVMPGVDEWIAIAVLGVLNTALALLAWDYAAKHGQLRALVSLSYLIPLLSAFILIAIGAGSFTVAMGAACLLIIGGCFIGSRDLFSRRTGST